MIFLCPPLAAFAFTLAGCLAVRFPLRHMFRDIFIVSDRIGGEQAFLIIRDDANTDVGPPGVNAAGQRLGDFAGFEFQPHHKRLGADNDCLLVLQEPTDVTVVLRGH